MKFREEGVRDIVKDVFLPWFQCVHLFPGADCYMEKRHFWLLAINRTFVC